MLYAQAHMSRAAYYCRLLAMPEAERESVAEAARDSIQRYFIGGSSHRQYENDRVTQWEYSRSNDQLHEMIVTNLAQAQQALEDELERCRQWLFSAFILAKQAKRPDAPECYREHNLMCARQWIKTRWPEYKAARKAARGF